MEDSKVVSNQICIGECSVHLNRAQDDRDINNNIHTSEHSVYSKDEEYDTFVDNQLNETRCRECLNNTDNPLNATKNRIFVNDVQGDEVFNKQGDGVFNKQVKTTDCREYLNGDIVIAKQIGTDEGNLKDMKFSKPDVNKNNAENYWKRVVKNVSDSSDVKTTFIAPNGSAFNSLEEVETFFLVMNGIENGLNEFLENLSNIPIYILKENETVQTIQEEFRLRNKILFNNQDGKPISRSFVIAKGPKENRCRILITNVKQNKTSAIKYLTISSNVKTIPASSRVTTINTIPSLSRVASVKFVHSSSRNLSVSVIPFSSRNSSVNVSPCSSRVTNVHKTTSSSSFTNLQTVPSSSKTAKNLKNSLKRQCENDFTERNNLSEKNDVPIFQDLSEKNDVPVFQDLSEKNDVPIFQDLSEKNDVPVFQDLSEKNDVPIFQECNKKKQKCIETLLFSSGSSGR